MTTSAVHGVLSVLCTPFTPTGEVDEDSLARLVRHQLAWGVDGLVVFGLAGELYKLTDIDRRTVLTTVLEHVNGAVPVIAGTEHTSTEGAVARSREATELGAAALMLYPPTFVKPDAAGVVDYFASVAAATALPIVIQDAPAWTGVPLPVELLTALAEASPRPWWVKVESMPSAPKIRELRHRGFGVVAGYGALHVAEDLATGAQAIMPGCALPGLYTQLWELHEAGDGDGVWALFARALPLLSFQMSSLDIFVAVQKRLLHRLGVLACPALRRPGTQLTDEQLRWLDRILQLTELDGLLGWPPEHADQSASAFTRDGDPS